MQVTNDSECHCDQCGALIREGQKMFFFKPLYTSEQKYMKQCYPKCTANKALEHDKKDAA